MALKITPNFATSTLDVALVHGQPVTTEEAIVVLLDELLLELRAQREDAEGRHKVICDKLDYIGVNVAS